MGEYLVIGPSKAGKSALLSTLYHASVNRDLLADHTDFRIIAENDAMEGLIAKAQQTIRHGKHPIDATNEVTEYRFKLVVREKILGILPTPVESATFRVWDGPGGVLFPIQEEIDATSDHVAHQGFRNTLVDALKRADGFMLCVDADHKNGDPTLAMFEHLPSILSATGLEYLPSRRVCVCLTKADAVFYNEGRDALTRAKETSPRSYAGRTVLPAAARGTLRSFCAPSTRVGFGWCSVYGFLPSGEPNYDRDRDGLRLWERTVHPTTYLIDNWRPFRVLEPFVFLATGREGFLEVIKAGRIV